MHGKDLPPLYGRSSAKLCHIGRQISLICRSNDCVHRQREARAQGAQHAYTDGGSGLHPRLAAPSPALGSLWPAFQTQLDGSTFEPCLHSDMTSSSANFSANHGRTKKDSYSPYCASTAAIMRPTRYLICRSALIVMPRRAATSSGSSPSSA